MNQQQLNKIDEEFDKYFSGIYFKRIDPPENYIYYEPSENIIKDFLHSKLQEAYELGREDERGMIINYLQKEYDYKKDIKIIQGNRCMFAKRMETLGESIARNNGFLSALVCYISKIKSLQTNKE